MWVCVCVCVCVGGGVFVTDRDQGMSYCGVTCLQQDILDPGHNNSDRLLSRRRWLRFPPPSPASVHPCLHLTHSDT